MSPHSSSSAHTSPTNRGRQRVRSADADNKKLVHSFFGRLSLPLASNLCSLAVGQVLGIFVSIKFRCTNLVSVVLPIPSRRPGRPRGRWIDQIDPSIQIDRARHLPTSGDRPLDAVVMDERHDGPRWLCDDDDDDDDVT